MLVPFFFIVACLNMASAPDGRRALPPTFISLFTAAYVACGCAGPPSGEAAVRMLPPWYVMLWLLAAGEAVERMLSIIPGMPRPNIDFGSGSGASAGDALVMDWSIEWPMVRGITTEEFDGRPVNDATGELMP